MNGLSYLNCFAKTRVGKAVNEILNGLHNMPLFRITT